MDNAAIRKKAAELLAGDEFQRYHPGKMDFDFWRWLTRFLHFKLPFEEVGHSLLWQWLGWTFKGLVWLAGAALAWLILRWLWRQLRPRPASVSTYRVSAAQREKTQAMYAQQAQEALARQDYRLAIHCLFLAAVSLVIQDAQFHAAEFMTNREMAAASDFSRFSATADVRRVFEAMVYFDEPRWFGQTVVSAQDYDQFNGFYRQFAGSVKVIAARRA